MTDVAEWVRQVEPPGPGVGTSVAFFGDGTLGAMAQEHRIAGPDPDGIHFTADFLATEKGMTFLEGGPPWFLGAHPGCFEGRDEVEGIALDKDEKPQPLTATERR